MFDALAAAHSEPSLDGLRRGAVGRALLALGLLSLIAGYVLPFAAEFRLPQHTQPVALEQLHVSRFAFPALRVPKQVHKQVALPRAPDPTRAIAAPQRRVQYVQRAVVPTQRVRVPVRAPVRVPVVSNRYVVVPPPKPAVTDDASAPVYEESIGAMPDAMVDPTTPDPVAQAAAQQAEEERIARLEAEARARAEAEAAGAAPAPAATPVVTATVTQISTAPATVAPTVTSPPQPAVENSIAPQPEPPVVVTPMATEQIVEVVAPPVTDPVPLPTIDSDTTAALPIDPDVAATPPPAPETTTAGSTGDAATATPATGDGGETATTTGGGTVGTGSAATTAGGDTVTTPAAETTITPPDPAPVAGDTTSPAGARGPPEGTTAISAADGGSASSADGGATVTFGAGTLLDDVYVKVTPSAVSAPADVSTASPAYDLVAYNANGGVVERFGGTAELTLSYSSPTPPRIYYLSPTDGAVALDTRVDPAAHTVQAWLVHFSTYVAATPLDEFADRPPVSDATVEVTVVAPDGASIADALVQATSDTGYQVRGRTDAAGTISFGVSRGLWTLTVGGVSNLQSTSQALDTTTGGSSYALTVALSEFAVYVAGSVRDSDGAPLAGVRVDARSENGVDQADDFAITGEDGSYRLGGLLGQWTITGQDLTHYYPLALESHYTPGASHSASLDVSAAATQDLTYTLMPRLLIGNLRDQNGDGVEGELHFEVYSHALDFHFSTSVITSPDGFYLALVPSDVVRVDIRPELQPAGYADLDVESTTWLVPSGDDGLITIAIADFNYYKFSTSASGVVRDELGTAVSGIAVAAEFFSAERGKSFLIQATTDATGAWTISGDAGEWTIYAWTSIAGYTSAALTGLLVGAEGLSGLEVVLVAGAAVTGTVTFQDTGASAAGVGVKVCGFTCSFTTTNSLGEYVAWLTVDPQTRSSNGTIELFTAHAGYARSAASVEGATAGGRFARDLGYVPFATPYSGIVLDMFGTPIGGAVVHLSDGLDETRVLTLADGTWSGLGPAREARVFATGIYPTSGSSVIIVAPAGTTDLQIALPAIKLAGTVTDQNGTPLAGVTVDAERWFCTLGAEACDSAGAKLATIASAVTDALGKYQLTLDPVLFSDNFPLRLASQRLPGYIYPGLLTPSSLPGQVTTADFEFLRISIEIEGVTDGAAYAHAVTPVVVATTGLDVELTLNGAPWAPGEISDDGSYTIVARALRSGAEVARAAVHLVVDTVAPTLTVGGVANGGLSATPVTPVIVATDANLAFTTMTLDGLPFGGGAIATEGRHVLVVSASDLAANYTSATIEFLIDATAPVTTLTTAPAAGPFDNASLFILTASDGAGSGVAATYWRLDGGAAKLYSAAFSLTGLTGSHVLSWYSTDAVGNTEAETSAALEFAHLEVVPAAPTRPDLTAADDSGLSNSDNVTFVNRPRFLVSTSANLLVELLEAGAVIGSAFANELGVASVQVALALADGTHAVSARVRVNAASTASAPSAALTVRIDTVAPSAPVLDLPVAEDSGASNADNVTNIARWHIYASTGDAVSLPTHELAPNGREITYQAVPAFVFFPDEGGGIGPDHLQGTWTYQARGVDLAGNVSALSNVLAITFDSIAPAAPARPDLPTADDSGVFDDDDITNVARPSFVAAAEVGAMVTIDVDGSPYAGTTLADGAHSVRARATDLAGNVSAASAALTVTIDTTQPAGTLVLNDGAAATSDPNVRAAPAFTDVLGPYQLRFSTDGGATWSDWQPYTTDLSVALIGADGVKTVLVEVRDRAGNAGAASDSIKLDRVGPVVTVTSPLEGGVYDVAQIVSVVFTAVDSSGIKSTTVTLDGGPLGGSSLDTLLLSAGTHTLVVIAVDMVGNVSTKTVTFEVRATIAGLAEAIRRGVALGLVDRREQSHLLDRLSAAASALARGDRADAARRLRRFADDLLEEAGFRVNRAFAERAAGWALDLAARL